MTERETERDRESMSERGSERVTKKERESMREREKV